jgi:hypothetical protein
LTLSSTWHRCYPSKVNGWSRGSLRCYSMSASDNLKPQLQQNVIFFSMTIWPIKDYCRLPESIW